MTKIEEMLAELCPNGVEWKELGEVCEIETGRLNANAAVDNGEYPFFTTAKEISWIDTYRWDSEALLIAGNANIGDVKYYSGKFEAYQRTYVLTGFASFVQVKFLYHYIKYDLKRYLERNTKKAAMSYIVLSTLKSFRIPVPPLEIQKEIVKILDKFTEYVTELTAELTAELTLRKKQYSFYRDQLLSFENEVYQVEWKTLGEILDYEQPTKYIVNSKDYNEVYPIPVLTAGQTFILGYTNETDGTYTASKEKPIIIFDDFTTASKWVDFEFKVKSSAMKILTIRNEQIRKVLIRYVWHYLGTIAYKPAQHGRQWIGIYSKIKIPIPPLDIQKRIVHVLDHFDEVCHDLNIGLPKEIELRQKQYEFFREKLLTFTAEGVYTDSTVQYSTVTG